MANEVARQLGAILKNGSRLLVAVSGGADSVALAHMLRGLPYQLTLGHVDHQLRRSSSRDAQFVQNLGKTWDLPVLKRCVRVKRRVSGKNQSIEEAARAVRYGALAEMAAETRSVAVLTAHHADDQAETVLFNFLRGAGPAGLAGMPVSREWEGRRLIRPLLGVQRRDLRTYLSAHRIKFQEDLTNRDTDYSRNRLRHQTLPLLERDFPKLSDRLVQVASLFRAEEQFWSTFVDDKRRQWVRQSRGQTSVDLKGLLGYHDVLGRRILRSLLPGVSYQDIVRLMDFAATPRRTTRLQLAGGVSALRRNNKLVISAGGRRNFSQGTV